MEREHWNQGLGKLKGYMGTQDRPGMGSQEAQESVLKGSPGTQVWQIVKGVQEHWAQLSGKGAQKPSGSWVEKKHRNLGPSVWKDVQITWMERDQKNQGSSLWKGA